MSDVTISKAQEQVQYYITVIVTSCELSVTRSIASRRQRHEGPAERMGGGWGCDEMCDTYINKKLLDVFQLVRSKQKVAEILTDLSDYQIEFYR